LNAKVAPEGLKTAHWCLRFAASFVIAAYNQRFFPTEQGPMVFFAACQLTE
jgi:hypothetical protein